MWLFKMRTYPQKPNRRLHVRYIPVCNHPIPNNNVTKSCFNWTAMPMLTQPKQRRADNDCIVGNLGWHGVSLTATFDSAPSIGHQNNAVVPPSICLTCQSCRHWQSAERNTSKGCYGKLKHHQRSMDSVPNKNLVTCMCFSTCVVGWFFLWRVSQQLLS